MREVIIKVTFDINWEDNKQSTRDYLPSQADLHFWNILIKKYRDSSTQSVLSEKIISDIE